MATYSDLPYDVLHQICVAAKEYQLDQERRDADQLSPPSLLNLSLVDRRTRDAALPVIFQTGKVRVKPSWFNTSEQEIHDLIDVLMKSDQILHLIKYFVIDPYFSKYNKFKVDYLPAKFGDLLFKFPNLNTLTLTVQPYDNAKTFLANLKTIIEANRNTKSYGTENSKAADLAAISEARTLSSVRKLIIKDDGLQFVTELCPNLEDLTVTSRSYWGYDRHLLDTQRLAELHPRLKRLRFCEPCGKEVLEDLEKHLPQIETLGLLSGYSRRGGCIVDHIPYLKGLKNLKHLALPYLSELGLGIHVPRCSQDWIDPQEAERQRQEARRRLVESLEKFLETAPTTSMAAGFNNSDNLETSGRSGSSLPMPMLRDIRVGSNTLFKVQRNGKIMEVNSK